MTKFLDGPAADVVLFLRRAPAYLRAVSNAAGTWDALDQLTDQPTADETIVVYRLEGEPSRVHVCRSPRSQSGWYEGGAYRVVDPQPDDAVLRDTMAWRRWVAQQVGRPVGDDGRVVLEEIEP